MNHTSVPSTDFNVEDSNPTQNASIAQVLDALQRVSRAESDAYFQSRPLPSRLGAWSSVQSSVLPSRDVASPNQPAV